MVLGHRGERPKKIGLAALVVLVSIREPAYEDVRGRRTEGKKKEGASNVLDGRGFD